MTSPRRTPYISPSTPFVSDLDNNSPARQQRRLGFDSAGRLFEVVVLRCDSGNELVIHPMRARRRYLDLLD